MAHTADRLKISITLGILKLENDATRDNQGHAG